MASQLAFGIFICGAAVGATAADRQTSLDGIPMRNANGAELYESGVYATTRIAPVAGNFYRWDEASLAVADGANVVIPFGQPALTPGRWLLQLLGGASRINALVPVNAGLTRIADFITTQAAGDVEMGPGLTQSFPALAGDVFLADISARARGTSGTPATSVRFRAKLDGSVQVVANGIDAGVVSPSQNAGLNGLLIATAPGVVAIQAFVEVINPPATPAAEVTVEEVNLRVVQMRAAAILVAPP